MIHMLKTWPEQFDAVWRERKYHEVRSTKDREFKVGDFLRLQEFSPVTNNYTGRSLTANVTYISKGGEFGLSQDICVMSIKVLATQVS